MSEWFLKKQIAAENSAVITEINDFLQNIKVILNWNNISQFTAFTAILINECNLGDHKNTIRKTLKTSYWPPTCKWYCMCALYSYISKYLNIMKKVNIFCYSFQKAKPIYYIDSLHIELNISSLYFLKCWWLWLTDNENPKFSVSENKYYNIT